MDRGAEPAVTPGCHATDVGRPSDFSEDHGRTTQLHLDPTVVVGSVSAGTTIEVDVTPLLSGNVLSLRVTSPSSNGADYSSKEAAAQPQLAVTVQ